MLPATETHAALAALTAAGEVAVALFADVACQRPLSNADWQLVPTPWAGLDAALPAVACRSRAEAGQVVRLLLQTERQRLRTSVLCLSRFLPACIPVCCHPHVV